VRLALKLFVDLCLLNANKLMNNSKCRC